MEVPFDIRVATDREQLAARLPTIDTLTFSIDGDRFIELLSSTARFLENPDWLIYQWGSFRPVPIGHGQLVLGLPDVLELGEHLQRLSAFQNFERLLAGFFNPPQFQDARFEARVAYHFSYIANFENLIFEPKYLVRGRQKRPDFTARIGGAGITVECKQPHIPLQNANAAFGRLVQLVRHAMESRK